MHAKGSTWAHCKLAPAISLKPTAGKSAIMHLLSNIRNRILLPCPFHLPFADPVLAMDEVESLRLGGLQTRPIWLGENEKKQKKKEADDQVTSGWHQHQRRQRRQRRRRQ